MIRMFIHRTPKGCLNLTLEKPYEAFGWFFNGGANKRELREMLDDIDRVKRGGRSEVHFIRENAEFFIDSTRNVAIVKVDNYNAPSDEARRQRVTESMELPLFRELVVEWLKIKMSRDIKIE